jgi:hypothetical protein
LDLGLWTPRLGQPRDFPSARDVADGLVFDQEPASVRKPPTDKFHRFPLRAPPAEKANFTALPGRALLKEVSEYGPSMKMRTSLHSFSDLIRCAALPVLVPLFGLPLLADVVIMKSGQVVSGTVLQQDEKGVLIKLDYGTFTWPNSLVKDVQRELDSKDSTLLESPDSGKRIPSWGRIISELAKRSWARELKQIPATVIDQGVLRNVPYVSFRCAYGGYELNIYGDMDSPAGFEIGVQKHLLNNAEAKSNCVELIYSILVMETDRQIVYRLDWKKEVVKKDGLTFEITLPTEPDSYGGWWVSVYDEHTLNKARASDKELRTITEPIVALPARTVATASPSTPAPATTTWSREDLSFARPAYSGSSSHRSSGGSVYVRGYTRKDGTYVQPHTRRAPRR